MMKQRLSKQQASEQLGVSLSTIDRMIRRKDLQVEHDRSNGHTRVWVLLDEEQVGLSGDTSPDVSDDKSRDAELEVLRERVRSAEQLAEYRAELLREGELRFHELLQTVENLTRALPAAAVPKETKPRGWWPFRRG